MPPTTTTSSANEADSETMKKLYASSRTNSTLTEMDSFCVAELNDEVEHVSLEKEEEEFVVDDETERILYKKVLEALSEDERKELPDANMPLRHLRAEKGDVEKAIEQIKNTLAWRKEFQVDAIKACFDNNSDHDNSTISEIRKNIAFENETGKVYARGYDKEGRAVLYLRPAAENSDDITGNIQHLVYNLERGIACTARKSGGEQVNIVIDYHGFKLRNAPKISTTKETLHILRNHYPEHLHRAFICNPPKVFRVFWSVVKPLLDPVTKKKIIFCHGKEGIQILEKDFDLGTLEECAGGEKGKLRKFVSEEYFATPFDHTFDETV